MKYIPLLFLFLATPPGVTLLAQSEREVIDKARNFKITLFGDWKPISYTDAVGRQKTDFIFQGNRQEGLLTIASEALSDRSLTNEVDIDLANMELSYATVFTSKEAFSII